MVYFSTHIYKNSPNSQYVVAEEN